MSVGLPVDKGTLDQRAGSLAWQLRETFEQIQIVKDWLDATPDATLEAAPYSYSSGEVATLKSAFTDMSNLGKIANGSQGGQTAPNNYLFWAAKLTGVQ
jgi:hypothetical protein